MTDELWKRGYKDEDIKKIYGGNKMRVYRQVWEGVSPADQAGEQARRRKAVEALRRKWQSR